MTDYIKREDAYQAVADNNYSDSITLERYDAILESIGNIKPADVREIVYGEWISVNDALPPRGKRVVACTHDGWVFVGKDFEEGDEINDSPNGVAYWMPLPEPPKGCK